MTREEGRLFKERWRLVNDAIADEVRRTPIALKLQQLAQMFGPPAPKTDEAAVRERWIRLKAGHRV